MAGEALDTRLVDALGYRDEVYAAVRKEAGPDAYLLYLGRYQRARTLAERVRKLPGTDEDGVGLIYATGPIRRGRTARGPVGGGSMGSDTVSGALRGAGGRPPGQGDRAAREQPGRIVRGLGHDLA